MAYLDYPGLQYYDGKIKEYIGEVPAQPDGTYPDMTVGNADQLTSTMYVEDSVPYLYRTSGGSKDIGDREYLDIVGGSVGWNQLCNSASVTVQSGHKYYMVKSGTASIGSSDGTAITGLTSGTDIVTDITLLLGSTIADYLYTLETATAGAGIAKLKSWGFFTKDYYAYDAGSLKSVEGLEAHETIGFNAYDNSTGKALVVGGHEYQITGTYTAISLDGTSITPDSNGCFTPSADGELTITGGNGTDTCVHLTWSGYRNGEYQPYVKHSYPIDSSLTLRGIPKKDADGNLYFDGDVYSSDGMVTRRYGIVDLGTLDWSYSTLGSVNVFYAPFSLIRTTGYTNSSVFPIVCSKYLTVAFYTGGVYMGNSDKCVAYAPGGGNCFYVTDSDYTDATTFKTAMYGVYLVYELTTPTTETADPFQSPQIVDDFGTEEFVTDSIVPVGHNTKYPANLRDKLQHLPSPTGTDGYYTIHEDGSQMTLSPLPAEIPAVPSTDGTYVLKATVSSGTVTLTWDEE